MNSACYNSGACIHCGCSTTALQMANKVCEGKEYPPIVNKDKWKLFVEDGLHIREGKEFWTYETIVINQE